MFRLFEAAFAVWLEMGVIMSFALMMSCAFGAVTSAVGALAFTFIGHGVVSFLHLGEGQSVPWWLPGLDIFNVINPVAHGSGYGLVYGLGMVLAMLAWVGLLVFAGALIFEGRDL
jgi:hypothetical protein